MEWHTLRGDAAGLYSLNNPVNHLTLKCSDIPTTEKDVAAFIGRRVQHHNYECTTHMVFEPADTCQHAGLVVMKDETHQYQFGKARSAEGNMITLRKIDEHGSTDIAGVPVDAAGVDLRVVSHGKSYDFMFSTDRGDTWNVLKTGVDARHTSTAAAGGFTGTVVGLYASKTRI